MANLVPAQTEITARVATWDAAGIIDAIRDHIVNDTTHLRVDDYNAGQGLTIGFLNGSEAQQVNLRLNAGPDMDVGIEPSGSITDAGNNVTAPTGTTADFSGEGLWRIDASAVPGVGSKVWIYEVPDSFWVLITDTTNAFQTSGLMAGRIISPYNGLNAATFGQDGLGFLLNEVDATVSNFDYWLGQNSKGLLHWNTNLWKLPVGLGVWQQTDAPDGTDGETYAPAIPMLAACKMGTTHDAPIGPFKYFRYVGSLAVALTVRPTLPDDQGWMHVDRNTGSGPLVVLCDKTITP